MAVGGYYFDASGLEELARSLESTADGLKDLSKVYRVVGRKAQLYVMAHEPIYSGSNKDSKSHPPPGFMQSRTKGGGGKTAWVSISKVPYIYVQEFGGASFWHKSGAGAVRATNRAHRGMEDAAARAGVKGHVIYKKPRKPRGYFIWNVAYRLRSMIGRELTTGIRAIGAKHDLAIEVTDATLDIEQKSWNRTA